MYNVIPSLQLPLPAPDNTCFGVLSALPASVGFFHNPDGQR